MLLRGHRQLPSFINASGASFIIQWQNNEQHIRFTRKNDESLQIQRQSTDFK